MAVAKSGPVYLARHTASVFEDAGFVEVLKALRSVIWSNTSRRCLNIAPYC